MIGTFRQGSLETDALIRNAGELDFGPDTVWEVTCIGVQDDHDVIMAVCGLPTVALRERRLKLQAEKIKAAMLH